jgi:6-pyruvoyltetrahydropterin/6-carboxytetrahydropterin synthase
MIEVRLERRYRFSASHLYRRPDWSEEQNRHCFGKCANLPGHGHNYRLHVSVQGAPAADTGFVTSLSALDELVHAEVVDVLDHQHLNAVVPEFSAGGKIPSSENLVLWIRARLLAVLPEAVRLVTVRVAEDDDLAAEWNAE